MTRVKRARVVQDESGRTLKVCTVCGELKEPEAFNVNAMGTLGRNSLCKACEAERRRAQYVANLDHRRALSRKNARAAYVRNPDRHREHAQRWREANPDKLKITARKNRLRRAYNISLETYEGLLAAQGGVCAICGGAPNGIGECYHVDHDHATGAIRGLLCHSCNTGIGALGDDPDRLRKAVTYLERRAADILSTSDVRKQQDDGNGEG